MSKDTMNSVWVSIPSAVDRSARLRLRGDALEDSDLPIERVVSGGQTGVDRAAFDAAFRWGITCGGWVPKGRLDECGIIPDRYQNLKEAEDALPETRTALNVQDSDATLILSHGPLQGGSVYTRDKTRELGRPCCHIDLGQCAPAEAARSAARWIRQVRPRSLNVAGPRSSEDNLIYDDALQLLDSLFAFWTEGEAALT